MNLQQTALNLLKDFDVGTPGTMFENPDLNLSIQDAYDLQFEVAAVRESRGEHVAGYKIGCISKTMQRQLGIDHPVFGHVWDSERYPSGVQLNENRFDGLAIEGELAIRVVDDIPSVKWLRKNPEVIADHQLVIELHNYVFRGSESARAVELVANNAIHAGVVIADEHHGCAEFDLKSTITVHRDSELLGESAAPHLENGIVDIVAAVAEHLAQRGRCLKRDQIVLAGSPLPLWKVAKRDCITVNCEGLAEVTCTIV